MLNQNKNTMICFLLIILLAACAGPPEPTQDVNAILTRGVGTMVASFFGTQTAMYTPPSPTSTLTQTPFPSPTQYAPPPSLPSPTIQRPVYLSPTPGTIFTLTALAKGTLVTGTINPASLGSGCNNLSFIGDVTIPAGTVLKPREDFVKTWKVENTGTCPWMYQYYLVSISGGDLDAGVTKIQKRVDVGEWTKLSINVTAPKTPGKSTSYWRLADANGVLFGATLVLSFEVKE